MSDWIAFVALFECMEIAIRSLHAGWPHLRRRKAATLVQAHRKIRNQRAAFIMISSRWLVEPLRVDRGGNLTSKDFRAEYWPARSTTPDGTLSLPNSLTRLHSAGASWVKEDPLKTSQMCVCGAAVPKTLAEPLAYVRYAGCRRLVRGQRASHTATRPDRAFAA